MHSNRQGSGLFIVLIIISALGFGIYSTSTVVNNQARGNKKKLIHHDAKQAAENLIQFGLAELEARLDNTSGFTNDSLSPTKNPLTISNEFFDRYDVTGPQNTLKITTQQHADTLAFNTAPTEIIGGEISTGQMTYLDPSEPAYENDELQGMTVLERNIELLSKATIDRGGLGKSTAFARQVLAVRDVPLFSYALYYNLPMEIAPGAAMDIYGNVHVNGDAWLQSDDQLNFHGLLTIAGDLHHGRHSDSGMRVKGGAVTILNDQGDSVNMEADDSWPEETKDNFTGTWLESLNADGTRNADFGSMATQVWDGNLKTQDHGVVTRKIIGMDDYIEDTDTTTAGKQQFNGAYPIIQPVLDEGDLSVPNSDTDPVAWAEEQKLREAEKQKFAYNAGLTIEVGSSGGLTFTTYKRDGDGNITFDALGKPEKHTLTPSNSLIANYESYATSGDTVTGGLYDKRQGEGVDLVELNMQELQASLDGNLASAWGGVDGDPNDPNLPENWWNGVVYVEFPQQNGPDRPDNVNPAVSGQGLKLINGSVIPTPSFARTNPDIDIGTSVATNSMLYVHGHYNADGLNINGAAATQADKKLPDGTPVTFPNGLEVPAALIADSVTFLSTSWDDADSKKDINTANGTRVATPTEVSAAILTGLVPSGETGSNSYSGGVENFPRFLEWWRGRDIVIRGSMVALFESEVAREKWGKGDVYKPPNRKWGFHEGFAAGMFPPGTPMIRNYRGTDFRMLSASEYSTRIAELQTFFP